MMFKKISQIQTLIIDDKEIGGRSDETILQVARENDIFIPTLCHLDGLSEYGGCRLCIVQVKGLPRLVPSCTTLIREGMEVITNSDSIIEYRKGILSLLFAERNHVCSVCVSNGHCELQWLASKLGMTHVEFPYIYPKMPVDATHDRFIADHNRCVLCGRCVRVCHEIEGAHTKDVMGRGITSRVITDLMNNWGESNTCTRCGKCVHVCPTGALSEKGKSVAEMEKRRQFLPYLKRMRERS